MEIITSGPRNKVLKAFKYSLNKPFLFFFFLFAISSHPEDDRALINVTLEMEKQQKVVNWGE